MKNEWENRITEAMSFFQSVIGIPAQTILPMGDSQSDLLYWVNVQYVVRLRGTNETLAGFAHPYSEGYCAYAMRAIRPLPFPPYVHFDGRNGNAIYRYEGRDIDLIVDDEREALTHLVRVKKLLDRFLSVPCQSSFDPMVRYYRFKKLSGSSLPSGFEANLLEETSRVLEGYPHCLCHNHLESRHIFLSEGRTRISDWQWGGSNAFIYDVASLLEENNIPLTMRKDFYRKAYPDRGDNFGKDVETLILFLHGFWHYYYEARYKETADERFKMLSQEKKNLFLKAFNDSLMD